MGNEAQQIVSEVVNKTTSELILFFVLVLVMLIVFFLPLYSMMRKERKERHEQDNIRQDKYIEREKQVIGVITANTQVISGLKTTLEISNTATTSSFARIHDRLDFQSEKMSAQGESIARFQTTLDELIRKQISISEDLKRGFSDCILK
jgi:heme/copper-type cytochrome/quinol oxidase subunit 2